MDTVTYPDLRVVDFIQHHFLRVRVPVKQDRPLAEEYLVSWTPNVVVADDCGRVHFRVEGYLPPEDFLAHLSLGIGKFWLNRKQFEQAARRFEEVTQRHRGTDAGAEALYWLGTAHYKQSHDAGQLQPTWQQLAEEYPDSDWTKRSLIPNAI